ncbi:D-alanyl-D-alanine carboxypeptidase/D-alanyl-D-alanine-endopeptidase [Caldimonas brevitalea]|uniref:Peptidase M15 n=1 Tax=Caldimonas brevitalea TaxID=413882 RepID=A0A0G3BM27_9BURK|nr:D-alanyl-D-alanine carboxypeptidase/D-alanyl-D-alanine-endopeptidase [Caldimonas brevitalea]AKJ27615.1 peptidase M15 [Caldimonas brevitalea]
MRLSCSWFKGGGWLAVALWMCLPARADVMPPAAPLPAEVAAALQRAGVPADAVAVQVIEVGATQPRLSHRAAATMSPASVMKLVTTYAALDLLGPAYTWRTPVYVEGDVRDGVLHGNLYLKGQGDPQLVMERLWLLLRRVQQLGITEIAGDIVLDRVAFDVAERDPGRFDGEPLRPYNVLPDALLVNYKALTLTFTPEPARGIARISADPPLAGVEVDRRVPLDHTAPCADWQPALRADLGGLQRLTFRGAYALACGERRWSIAYADPKSFNARAVEALWRGLGGGLRGLVRDGVAPRDTAPLFESESPPLAEVVRDVNKFSHNTMARQLFLTLALERRGLGTDADARAVVAQWVQAKWGAVPELVLDNGAGLSRDERLSAAFLARLLQSAWAAPVMPELLGSLPITGVDGTLRRSGAQAVGRAHLKTGTLRDVASLAGYVLADSGQRYVLVALINHPNATAARPALDALIDWTAKDLP